MQVRSNYELLVESEDMLVNLIEICSETIDAVLQMLFKRDGPIHLLTVHDVVVAIHEIQVKLDRELLLVRIEKRLTARNLDCNPS
jgi:hypothetical protein